MPDPNHWEERFRKPKELNLSLTNLMKGVLKTSQMHGASALEGEVRVIVNSFYPLEREFTHFFIGKDIANLTGHSLSRIKQLKNNHISYFKHLQLIYDNLLQNHNKTSTHQKGKYMLVKNYQEIIAGRKKNKHTIFIINSIEGAHSFASDIKGRNGEVINLHKEEKKLTLQQNRTGDGYFEKHIDAMVANIAKMKKSWEFPPLFVTFSHHYYNHLAGHSPSLGMFLDLIIKQHGRVKVESGKDVSYFDLGFRRWGMKVLVELLKRTTPKGQKVRRVLIDTKHLSVQARIEYHQMRKIRLQIYNDSIPIIQSHTAVSGRKSMQATVDNDLALRYGEKKRAAFFNPTVLNLFDDEIMDIVSSDGLMGIMLDEKRVVGKMIPPEGGFKNKRAFNKEANQSKKLIALVIEIKHKILWEKDKNKTNNKKVERLEKLLDRKKKALQKQQEVVKPAYMAILFRQLFHIVSVAGVDAWSHVSLGTDYEGVINPLDIYPQSKDLKYIESDMILFWNNQRNSRDRKVRKLYKDMCFHMDVKTIVRKFLWNNASQFLKKYFTDKYLLEGVDPK